MSMSPLQLQEVTAGYQRLTQSELFTHRCHVNHWWKVKDCLDAWIFCDRSPAEDVTASAF